MSDIAAELIFLLFLKFFPPKVDFQMLEKLTFARVIHLRVQ